jgi:hypothetical protein
MRSAPACQKPSRSSASLPTPMSSFVVSAVAPGETVSTK